MAGTSKGRLLILHALTFLHPGTGQTTGVVDLPIQREIHTGFPMIASSGLKGSLRAKAEAEWRKGVVVDEVFGSENAQTAGAVIVTDARILAFPVRSLQGVFVWITCPMVIGRLERDAALAAVALGRGSGEATSSQSGRKSTLDVKPGTVLVTKAAGFTSPLVLEEIALEILPTLPPAADLAAILPDGVHADMATRLVVVADEEFQYLVRTATQVSARILLNDETKTTSGSGGNLWYEETLPPETVMYALVLANAPRNSGKPTLKNAEDVMGKVADLIGASYLQVGGNETVGQGWCRVKLVGG